MTGRFSICDKKQIGYMFRQVSVVIGSTVTLILNFSRSSPEVLVLIQKVLLATATRDPNHFLCTTATLNFVTPLLSKLSPTSTFPLPIRDKAHVHILQMFIYSWRINKRMWISLLAKDYILLISYTHQTLCVCQELEVANFNILKS